MNHLNLHRKPKVRGRINLYGAVPDRWLGLSLTEIAAWPIEVDHRPSTVGQVFDLVDGPREQWLMSGDLRQCDSIAAEMLSGEIIVEGSVGDHLASYMRGGRVLVHGDAGAYVASSLRGGRVTVTGNVGSYAAAVAPHKTRGMAGGELIVHGNADQWLANRMRRGLVVVHGHVGSGCATRMIAGTLVACSHIATPLGCGMVRGTLLLLDSRQELMTDGLVGFTTPTPCQLSFLPMLLREIIPHLPVGMARELSSGLSSDGWLRCLGDRADLGLGEVLLRQTKVHPTDAAPYPS